MYNLILREGMIVPIYTDYKEETIETLEGVAVLINKISVEDAFFRNEELIKLHDDSVMNIVQIQNEKYYNEVINILTQKRYVSIYKDLLSATSNTNQEYNTLNVIVNHYKSVLSLDLDLLNSIDKAVYGYDLLNMFIRIPNDIICRIIQQHKKVWNETIFRAEMWKVEFIYDHNNPLQRGRICNRKIRYIVKNKFVKNELQKNMTYNNITNSKFSDDLNLTSRKYKMLKTKFQLKDGTSYKNKIIELKRVISPNTNLYNIKTDTLYDDGTKNMNPALQSYYTKNLRYWFKENRKAKRKDNYHDAF